MNCKPGDLAVVVDLLDGTTQEERAINANVVGRIVRVTTPRKMISGLSGWNFEFPIVFRIGRDEYTIEGISDRSLRPINGVPVDEEVRDEVTA